MRQRKARIAAGCGEAVPEHLGKQHWVDVAAGEHEHDRRLERVRVIEQRSDRGRTGGLDKQLGPLQAEQQRTRKRVLETGQHLLDERRDDPEGKVARLADGDPVRHGRGKLHLHRVPGRERDRVWRRRFGLHAEDADALGSLPRAPTATPAMSPPPPTDTAIVRTSGHCSTISRPRVAFPATVSGWSKGWMKTLPRSSVSASADVMHESTLPPWKTTSAP